MEKGIIDIIIIDPESEKADEQKYHSLTDKSGASLHLDDIFDIQGTPIGFEFVVNGARLEVFTNPPYPGAERINLTSGDSAILKGDKIPFIGRFGGRRREMIIDYMAPEDGEMRSPVYIEVKLNSATNRMGVDVMA